MTASSNIPKDIVAAFLAEAGWSDAKRTPIAGDASTRAYERLDGKNARAVLMLAPPAAETAPCPVDASPKERTALGYNALARLAGPNLNAFVELANTLRGAGLSAPEIYAANADAGLAVIEDFGDDLFARAIERGADERTLYEAAIDALVSLAAADPAPPASDHYVMLTYDEAALHAEVDLLTEWYWPLKSGVSIHADQQAECHALWRGALQSLSPPHQIVLRDYHAENLLWLPERKGAMRAGLIDFQDGLYGHGAYDLVSLLEDARRDVDLDLAEALKTGYVERRKDAQKFDESQFENDYGVLAAQRNAKILGIFARLARRDGKERYLSLLPRVEAHFRRDLKRPGLENLQKFFAKHLPDLAS